MDPYMFFMPFLLILFMYLSRLLKHNSMSERTTSSAFSINDVTRVDVQMEPFCLIQLFWFHSFPFCLLLCFNVIFKEIMSTQKEKMLKKLCMFILKIYVAVCPSWFPDYYYYLLSVLSLYILYLWLVCSLLYICYYCTSCTIIGLSE